MDLYLALVLGHIIGTSLGVGGATVSDFLVLRGLRDGKVDSTAFRYLSIVSSLVWLGLALLTFSGFGFLLLYRLDTSLGAILDPMFLIKLTVVVILFVNALVMHQYVMPLIEAHKDKALFTPKFIKRRGLMMTTGAISVVSWYSALVLGVLRGGGAEYSYFEVLGWYLAAVLLFVIIFNVLGQYLSNRNR